MNIEWMQVLIAFALGVLGSATVRGIIGKLKADASGALGG